MKTTLAKLAQELAACRSLTVITGAGISAESGISTFRGINGYWQQFNPYELASPDGFQKDPALVWRWYDERRRAIMAAKPNPGHQAIAELEKRFERFQLITQNVDGLHQLAGSSKIIEIHGSIWQVRCTRSSQQWENRDCFDNFPVYCKCGALLRPAVLWFGESYVPALLNQAMQAAQQAEFVMVIGCSGQVWIVAGLVAQAHQAKIAEFNLEATELKPDYFIAGPAGQSLPELVLQL